MNNIKTILIALLATAFTGVQAQQASAPAGNPTGLYVGAQAHSPLFWGDMFSLGKETRLGYGGGVFAGYTVGGWLSPEISFDYGVGRLGAQAHQLNDYFNKAGIIKYVQYDATDMKLGDVYSKTTYMQAGLRLQVGLISLMRGGRYTPFDVELAPAVYAQKFSPALYAANGDKKLDGYGIASQKWNYAVGGDLGLRYRFSPKLSAHLRGGLLWLRNEAFEGVNNDPLWRVNLMANASVGITIHLGKSGQTIAEPPTNTPAPTYTPPAPDDSAQKAAEAERLRQEQLAKEQQAQAQAKADAEKQRLAEEQAKREAYKTEVAGTQLPPVLFRRGSALIHADLNSSNIDEIVTLLNKYPDAAISIEGWCDVTGTERINDRLSQQRAEALQKLLTEKGIAAERFTSAQGMGVDTAGGYKQIARRAQVKLTVK